MVEQSQDTGKRWAGPPRCRYAAELQWWIDEMDWIQRERYPPPDGRIRLEIFPALAHSGRPCKTGSEPEL